MSAGEDLKRAVEEVCSAVDEAVKNSDFSGLGKRVDGLVKDVSSGVSRFLGGEGQEQEVPADTRKIQEIHPEYFFAEPESEQLPGIAAVVGGAMAVIFGLITAIAALLTLFTGVAAPVVVLMGIMTALSIALVHVGRKASRKRVRFKSYRKLLLPRLYGDVRDLAAGAGCTEKEAVADLGEFTREGKIKQGHFDEGRTCFIASDELYAQYRETAERQKAQSAAKAAQAKKERERITPEVREVLDRGEAYIAAIRKANDGIADRGISDKLDRMESIVRRIFDEVKERPELAGKLNMFLNYYLPTTTRLMDAYVDMDRQPVQGDNIRKAKQEIEDSLDTINDAFESLLDSFFKEKAMDVSSDINVMKMMMKQDGLTEDDFAAMRRKQDLQFAQYTAPAGMGAAAAAAAPAAAVQEEGK